MTLNRQSSMDFPESSTDFDGSQVNNQERGSKDLQRVTGAPTNSSKDYPHGFRLFIVVAAMFISMFLLALDLVCSDP